MEISCDISGINGAKQRNIRRSSPKETSRCVTDAVAASKQKEKQESKTTWISVHSCAFHFCHLHVHNCHSWMCLLSSYWYSTMYIHPSYQIKSNLAKSTLACQKKQPFLVQNLLIRLSTFGKHPDSLQDTEKG